MSIMQTMLRSSHFEVVSHVCQHPRVDCGSPLDGDTAHFLFTRRGSFALHVGRKTFFARPGNAVLIQRNVEYRITHPDALSCDCCTDLQIDEATMEAMKLTGPSALPCRNIPHDLQFQKTHVELLLGLRRDGGDILSAEETLLETLAYLLKLHENDACGRVRSSTNTRRVARAQEAIIAHVGENLEIDALARYADCSPFYLCRIFRSGTGQSLRQFRLQQRLGNAVGRLGDGEEDLAALACDLGFSNHSHMSEAFRQSLGASPSELREDLRHSDLSRLRSRLRAPSGSRNRLS